jgi:hypothetical protein
MYMLTSQLPPVVAGEGREQEVEGVEEEELTEEDDEQARDADLPVVKKNNMLINKGSRLEIE